MREGDATSTGGAGRRLSVLWAYFPASFLGATLAYCLFIYWLSSVSSFPYPPPVGFFDKTVHFFLYSGLGAIVALGLRRARHEYSARVLFVVPVGFCAVYGLSDEAHQLFVASRSFSMGDVAADTVGAAVAAGVLLMVFQVRKRKG